MSKINKLISLEEGIPKETTKLFFGDYDGFIRQENIQYPKIMELVEASESNTWFVNEIDYDADVVGWKDLPPEAQNKFEKNISYQNLMDSGVVRLFAEVSKVANVSELQYLYNRINTEENIHALTYSNGIDTVFGADAKRVLDRAYTDPVIQARIKNEQDGFDEFYDLCIIQGRQDDEAKMSLLKLLGATFMLEGIKFPFSFYVTWAINKAYGYKIQGFSRALKLIGWDELTVHTVTGSTVINRLRKDKSQGFSHLFKEFDAWLVEYAQTVVENELSWNDYLLEDGEIPGYNQEIGEHFIKYWAGKRCKEVHITDPFKEKKSDIIDWFNKYRDLNSTTTALQEAETTNYQKGKLKDDLSKFDNI